MITYVTHRAQCPISLVCVCVCICVSYALYVWGITAPKGHYSVVLLQYDIETIVLFYSIQLKWYRNCNEKSHIERINRKTEHLKELA